MAAQSDLSADSERQKELEARLQVLDSEQQERMARYRAEQEQLPYVNLLTFPIDPDVLEIVPKLQADEAGAVLFHRHGNDVRIGAVNPGRPSVAELQRQLEERFGVRPQLHVISNKSFLVALSRYRRALVPEVVPAREMRVMQTEVSESQKTLASLEDLGKRITSLAPTQVLRALVVGAVQLGASDIHIEPKEKSARLRYRIDGVLQDVAEFARDGWALMLSRIKVLTRLKLNVHDVPQDGSFVLKVGEATYDMRVSILPGAHGENIVLRLLNREVETVTVKDLGMKQRDYELVLQELKRPNGMILVTGPTGSGKTTTLAAFLREVNNPELKIITLEDPIEYRLPGVEQTQVDEDSGYTFAKGLRAILRQDPDMILVGEMRDSETVDVAINAALTGHLVFSTLHTNDAPGAVPRMIAMGAKPFVLAPALNLIIAQRLVRRVCTFCAEEYTPDQAERARIAEVMAGIRKDVFDISILSRPSLKFLRAKGCARCGKTGYKGRVGVFEAFAVHERMQQLVLRAADGMTIKEEALKQGMTTIAQDGFLKVIDKVTTVDEVERTSEE